MKHYLAIAFGVLFSINVCAQAGRSFAAGGDNAAAEQVFRADLERNKRNGRSLFGLMESLKAQKKDFAALMVKREFDTAWKDADTPLKIEDVKR